MITLEDQFQMMAMSILFGMGMMVIWGFFNRLFYRWKRTIFRGVFEIILFSGFAWFYWRLLIWTNGGVLSFYLPFALGVGVLIYQATYGPHVLVRYEKSIYWLKKILLPPLLFTRRWVFGIMNSLKSWRWHLGTKSKHKALDQSDTNGVHRLVWNLPDSDRLHRQSRN